MKKQPKSYIFYMGIAIFAVGLLLKVLFAETEGAMQTIPFVLTGFGGGIIGVGVVNLFRIRLLKNNPEKAKQLAIEEKDERNVRLREKAGYATWYITMFALAALSMTFVVLDYKLASFLSIGLLLIHIISLFVCISIYNKKL